MKTALIFLCIWIGTKVSCAAQSRQDVGEKTLGIISMALNLNSRTDKLLLMAGGMRQVTQFDSMPQTAENLHQRAMFEPNMETAIGLLEKSTELDPKFHNTVGWSYLVAYHDYPHALRHLNAYDDLTPGFDDTDGMSPVSYLKGLCHRNLGNHTEAVRQFNKGIDSLIQKHGTEWVNYKHFVSRAVSYIALNQFDKAMSDLDAGLKNCTSDSPMILYVKGKLYQKLGRFAEAKRAFQDAKFYWQANNAKGISQPEDDYNLVLEDDIDEALKR